VQPRADHHEPRCERDHALRIDGVEHAADDGEHGKGADPTRPPRAGVREHVLECEPEKEAQAQQNGEIRCGRTPHRHPATLDPRREFVTCQEGTSPRSISYRISGAKFPVLKDLDSFVFTDTPVDQGQVRELATGVFLDAKRNGIFIGGTGTGKTHLCIASLPP
jgi:DNA replication protein DnaC